MIKLLATTLLGAIVAGCALFDSDQNCTLVGCDGGLTVQLPSVPAGAFKVELLVQRAGLPGEVTYLYECASGSSCKQEIFFPNLTPSRVSVRVTTTAGVKVTEFTNVTYARSQPNGEDCEPTCLNATIDAPLPA